MSEPFDPWIHFPRTPRAWQARAYPIAMTAIRSRERCVVQACTGAGKSWLIEAIVLTVVHTLKPGFRVLVSVPTKKLVEQTSEGLEARLGAHRVGRWYTGAKVDRTVIVACQDSLSSLADYMIGKGLGVALWLSDECHRGATEEVQEPIGRLDPKTRLGITATPFRSCEDEALVGWDRLVFRYTIDEAIADGVLVPFRLVPWDGDDDADLDEATASMIQRKAPPGPGIVSASTIEDAIAAAAFLTERGIPAEPIHSKIPKSKQAKIVDRLLRGELRCLVHVALLVEGVDFPPLRWLAMRRDRKAAVGIVQEVGRVLRTCEPDRWGEKTSATVLLPHPTPILDSIERGAALSPDPLAAARALERKAEEELQPEVEIETVLPTAKAVGDVEGYFAALVEAARDRGVTIAARPPDTGWRSTAPSGAQRRALVERVEDGRRSGLRFLPEEHRASIRRCLRRPEVLTRGGVSDLIALLDGLEGYGRAYNREHAKEGKGWWNGIASIYLPNPPTIAIREVVPDEVFRKKRGRGRKEGGT